MSEFVKQNNIVMPKPQGTDYDLESGRIYRLKVKREFMSRTTMLVADGNVEIPHKIYTTPDEDLFIKRTVKYHKESDNNTTGVMLYGAQGCGKTMFSKVIAKEIGLPVIIVDPSFDTSELIEFFTKFKTPVTIIFDELDKHCSKDERWNTKDMLEFLDGFQTTCKKLVIFTCNSDKIVNEFLKNRCGRIRYYKEFAALKKESIENIVNDIINDKNKIEDVTNAIVDNVKLPSYDNVLSICKEVNDWPSYTTEELLIDLNVELK